MRYAAILLLPLLFICSCASQETRDETPATVIPAAEDSGGQAPAPESEVEKQRLAVLDMEDTTGDIDDDSLAQATDYLRVLVVQSQRFIVVSDEEKQALIRELRKESHSEQYDESQRVPLGQRVAANVTLITTILKIQEDYILKAELVDLAKEAIIAGATEKFLPDTFQQAIEAVAQAVTTDKKEPAETMVATASAEETAPAGTPADRNTEVAVNYSDDEYHHHHNGDGVNFVIINLVSSRHGREPDPYYRSAEERRREREARRREEAARRDRELPTIDDLENPADSIRNEASSGGRPPEKQAEKPAGKPIQFKLVKKPILFIAPEKKRPSSITLGEQPEPVKVHPKATRDGSAPLYTLPSNKEKVKEPTAPAFRIEPKKSAPEPVRVEPKKSESPFFKRAPSSEPQPAFKKETSSPVYKKSEPAASPRPLFNPSKSIAPSKNVTPAPPSNSSSSKKKKKDDDDDDDKKKEEKKKKSGGTIFLPKKR